MPDAKTPVALKKLTNEELVNQLRKFASYCGVGESCDPFWPDPRPEGWGVRFEELEREVLRRLNHKR